MNNQAVDITLLLKEAIISVKPEMKLMSDEITSDRSFAELGIESINVFEIAGHIEDHLNIVLPNGELSGIKTVGDVERIILNQLS